ncbi:hypothetical protein COV11_00630 [Candidatus Woesearchaeota archaeon CG10_big_fil_rev_8_21_14_0_10_30_7]|nr:MAG: hypothetical protein COV11_00630 [Candidatus Woesearchaeota archaeon CG10_big_fil_rev_8_21_14_0_10_30_7]
MGLPGFVFTFVLLLINLFGTLRLKSQLTQLVNLELALVCAGLFLWLIALLGLYFHKRWAWNWNIVLFSLSLANVLWLYTFVGGSLTFVVLLGFNALGLVSSMVGLELYIPNENLDNA